MDIEIIHKLETIYEAQEDGLFENSISNNSIKDIFRNRSILQNYTYAFSKKIPVETDITDQEHSGRCWIFSFTNVLRIEFIKKHKLPSSFMFSNTYLYFYDKLEKSYYFLKNIEETKDKGDTDRLVMFLLNDPTGDGGFWNMACNLIMKYGMVPEKNMRESRHSSHSGELNNILKTNLLMYAKDIRSGKKYKLLDMMVHIYSILCYFLGQPTKTFNWEYHNSRGKLEVKENLTPLDFAKKYVKFNPNEYVSLVNYPLEGYPMCKRYSIKYCNNMTGGDNLDLINVPIKDLRKYSVLSLKKNMPVWFGSDVGKFHDSESGIMDEEIFNYEKLFNSDHKNFSKRDRVITRNSFATHAMVLIGYDRLNKKTFEVDKWLVENSWGNDAGNQGYFRMSNDWFNKFVFVIIVKKSLVNKKIKSAMKSKVKELMPWDLMSCDAMMLK